MPLAPAPTDAMGTSEASRSGRRCHVASRRSRTTAARASSFDLDSPSWITNLSSTYVAAHGPLPASSSSSGTADFHSPDSSRNSQRVEVDGKSIARSEEHTSELQSLMRISYAVFCLKKKTKQYKQTQIYY